MLQTNSVVSKISVLFSFDVMETLNKSSAFSVLDVFGFSNGTGLLLNKQKLTECSSMGKFFNTNLER